MRQSLLSTWSSSNLGRYKPFLPIQMTRMLRSYLVTILCLNLGACQNNQAYTSSSWALTEHVLDSVLTPQSEFDADEHHQYMSKQAQTQIQTFAQAQFSDESLGLLSIEQNQKGTWHALYGYQRQQWPLLLQIELEDKGRSQKTWRINSFPFLNAYRQLAQLIPSSDSTPNNKAQELGHLPKVKQALPWRGGLSGRDRRGRLQSSVVVVWCPPLVFVDGQALAGRVDRPELSLMVKQAFEKRRQLAHQAQASYSEHVSLALPAKRPASELIKLMAWMEGIGTQQVSLLVQSEQGPGLIYLAARSSTQSLYHPQRLLHVQYNQAKQTKPVGPYLTIRQSDQKQEEKLKRRLNSTMTTWRNHLFEFMEHAQARDLLHGVVIHTEAQTSVNDLTQFIDHYRSIDQELPLTLAPIQTKQR